MSNITASLRSMETWVMPEQDMALVKSITLDMIIVLEKHVLEKCLI